MKYKIKESDPIDAIQFTEKNRRGVFDFLTADTFDSKHMSVDTSGFYIKDNILIIKTVNDDWEGVNTGDYIIRKGNGYEILSEKEFKSKYEPTLDYLFPISPTSGRPWINPPLIPYEHADRNSDGKVPYFTICPCNPANGGNGVCGCIMGNKLVYPNKPNFITTTTGNFNLDDFYNKDSKNEI